MSEHFEHKDSLPVEPDDQDAVALIRKMQQQLAALEKKIDILLEQSSRRPSGERPFSKPFRSFSRPHRPFDRAHGDASGEKRFDRGRHFGKRPSEESPRFDHKRKTFGDSRESGFSQDRNFARRNDGPRGGFEHKKKPFPYKRKSRE
ncbi:MAG: hypothetical protein WDL87_09005 [Candidatus Omnitrophota bacterium]|jgi:hypothetical protein